jgi:hypothetical protein
MADGDPNIEVQILLGAISHPYSVNVNLGDKLMTWSKIGTICVVKGIYTLVKCGVHEDTIRCMVESVISYSKNSDDPPLEDRI